jgi:hypothetical protein
MDPMIKHLISSFWSEQEHFDMGEIIGTTSDEYARSSPNSPMSIDDDDDDGGGIEIYLQPNILEDDSTGNSFFSLF